jgi:hypothetical protein
MKITPLVAAVGILSVTAVICLLPKAPTKQASASTLDEACRASLTKLEKGNYAAFQINNVATLAPGKLQIFYEVGHSIGPYANQVIKERQLAICTGTIARPEIELVSANAKKETEAAEAAASQAALQEAEASLQAELKRFKALEAQYSAQ